MPENARKFRVSITLLIPNKSGLVWWPAEVDVPVSCRTDDEAMDFINSVIVEDGSIRVLKLDTETDGRARVIRQRVPVIVSANGYATITPIHVELLEDDQQ